MSERAKDEGEDTEKWVLWFHAFGEKSARKYAEQLKKAGFIMACEPAFLAAKEILSDLDYFYLRNLWRKAHGLEPIEALKEEAT